MSSPPETPFSTPFSKEYQEIVKSYKGPIDVHLPDFLYEKGMDAEDFCSDPCTQEDIDDLLIVLNKEGTGEPRGNTIAEQIELLEQRIKLPKITENPHSVRDGFQLHITRACRLFTELQWFYAKQGYTRAERLYRNALYVETDKNNQCEIAILLINLGWISKAKAVLQAIQPSSEERDVADSFINSYDRACEMLTEVHHPPTMKPYMGSPCHPSSSEERDVADSFIDSDDHACEMLTEVHHPPTMNPSMVSPYHHHPPPTIPYMVSPYHHPPMLNPSMVSPYHHPPPNMPYMVSPYHLPPPMLNPNMVGPYYHPRFNPSMVNHGPMFSGVGRVPPHLINNGGAGINANMVGPYYHPRFNPSMVNHGPMFNGVGRVPPHLINNGGAGINANMVGPYYHPRFNPSMVNHGPMFSGVGRVPPHLIDYEGAGINAYHEEQNRKTESRIHYERRQKAKAEKKRQREEANMRGTDQRKETQEGN